MARIRREEIIDEALTLLDLAGLDGVTTRKLAQRLGVESASLYWHFKNKLELLNEMSAAVLARHYASPIPQMSEQWQSWFFSNARRFRYALLAHRDGARLHAGTRPNPDELNRLSEKVLFLIRAGFKEQEALMALYSMGQFTIGCVLEEQVRASDIPSQAIDSSEAKRSPGSGGLAKHIAHVSASEAFEFGLQLLVNGLETRLVRKEEPRQSRSRARKP